MVEKTLVFRHDKETKNTHRYKEETNGQPPIVGSIYVQKWAIEGERPEEIEVTLDL